MITSLRWFRGFIGFLVIVKFSSTLNFIIEVLNSGRNEYLVATIADIVIFSIFFCIYYALYKLINKINVKYNGNKDAPLLKSMWSL